MKTQVLTLVLSFWLLGVGLFLKTKDNIDFGQPGTVAGRQTALWSLLPPDLPLLPQANLMSTLQKNDGLEVTLETSEAPLVVEKFYKEKLSEGGWQFQDGNYFKGGKKFNWQIAQNNNKTQSVVLLNYVFVPTK